MIFLKTEDEIELLRQSNLLVGKTLAEVAKLVKPGVTTRELDKVAEEFIIPVPVHYPVSHLRIRWEQSPDILPASP